MRRNPNCPSPIGPCICGPKPKKKREKKPPAPVYRPFSVRIPNCRVEDDTQGGEPLIVNLVITVWAKDARYAIARVGTFLSEQISREEK